MNPELEQEPAVVALPASADGLAVGTVLKGTYRIVRPLAEGGFGKVYLAAHTRLPGQFAVKLLHRTLARDAEALARFRQEAEITSTLSHPHIVQVFDYNVTDGGVPYLVMELLEGQSLADLVASGVPLPPARAIAIIDQIAHGLYAAHQRGIVHRDLKPENIMLLAATGAEDFVKILDFGISKASWRTRLTQNDTVSGTPQYMAPEQARAQREEIDHRADQFSLAAIAYTLFTGREPFSGEDPVVVLYQVVHEEPPAPKAVNPALGMIVDGVIARGLSKDPANRYPDVLAFAAALRAAVAETGGVGSERGDSEAPAVDDGARDARADLEFAGVDQTLPEDREATEEQRPGRETRRLIRRVRRRSHRPRRILTAVLAAGLLAVAWFHPATRTITRAGWHEVEHQVSGLWGRLEAPLRSRLRG